MPRFSANLGFLWRDRPLPERIEAAADAGFKAIELHWHPETPPEAVKAACGRRGLKLLGINAPGGDRKGDFGLAALPGREADLAAAMEQAFAFAETAGATAIHVLAGYPRGVDPAEARKTYLANMRALLPRAGEMGLKLLLEPLNRRDQPDYFCSQSDMAAELAAELASPHFGVMFDCYHVAISEGDVSRRLERHLPLIGHVQIAAVPSRREPDEGEIAYRHIFDLLDRLGYSGWIGCEYVARGAVEDGLAWTKALGVELGKV